MRLKHRDNPSVIHFSRSCQGRTDLGCIFFFNDTATTEIYTNLNTLPLHDALPISRSLASSNVDANFKGVTAAPMVVRARSEEHTSELQSHSESSYAVFCLKKK